MDERRDDWHHGVDENLASLNAGQRVWEYEQKVLRRELANIDRLLRGDVEQETDGLIARLHKQETEIRLLNAITLTDKAGNPGLDTRVARLEENREDRRFNRGNITKIIVAIITSGALGLFWRDIISFMNHKSNAGQMIENTKRPKGNHRHIVIKQEPEDLERD